MSKKQANPQKERQEQKGGNKSRVVQLPGKSYVHQVCLVIILFVFILYGNTLSHDYALDDAIVITQNQFTKQGFSGIKDILTYDTFMGFFGKEKNLVAGGRYRPLSLVTFAVEFQLFGFAPGLSHLINILLYALTAIFLYIILDKLLRNLPSKRWYLSVPFITTMLYVAHPIHTEVVANIKGRDEILSLLGSLLAMYYTLSWLETRKMKYMILSFVILFLALMSKENAITFVAIIPLSVYFFTKHPLKNNLVSVIPLLLASFVFIYIRHQVLGSQKGEIAREIMNNPFLYATEGEKYATIFYTWLLYIKLLIFPHPLTYDYYPFHIPIKNWGDIWTLVSLFFHIFLAIVILSGLRKKNRVSYALLFYFISFSILSNLVFPIGTFMNERFMYISSFGFCLILADFIIIRMTKAVRKEKTFIFYSTVLLSFILLLYSVKTISRNTVWKNDFFLFTTDVKTSFRSAKSNCSAGGKLTEESQALKRIIYTKYNDIETLRNDLKQWTVFTNREIEELLTPADTAAVRQKLETKRMEYLELALKYLNKSIEIHPDYSDALLLIGNAWYEHSRNYEMIIKYYSRILKINPQHNTTWDNIQKIFSTLQDVDRKIRIYEDLYKINPDRWDVNYNLGQLYGKYKNDLARSIGFLEKATKLKPNDALILKDMGVAYGLSGQYDKAVVVLEQASRLDPKDSQVLQNIGITYQNMTNFVKAGEFLMKAHGVDPKNTFIISSLVINFLSMGNAEKAQEYLNKGIQLQAAPDFFINIGYFYKKAGNEVKAQEFFNRATAMNHGQNN